MASPKLQVQAHKEERTGGAADARDGLDRRILWLHDLHRLRSSSLDVLVPLEPQEVGARPRVRHVLLDVPVLHICTDFPLIRAGPHHPEPTHPHRSVASCRLRADVNAHVLARPHVEDLLSLAVGVTPRLQGCARCVRADAHNAVGIRVFALSVCLFAFVRRLPLFSPLSAPRQNGVRLLLLLSAPRQHVVRQHRAHQGLTRATWVNSAALHLSAHEVSVLFVRCSIVLRQLTAVLPQAEMRLLHLPDRVILRRVARRARRLGKQRLRLVDVTLPSQRERHVRIRAARLLVLRTLGRPEHLVTVLRRRRRRSQERQVQVLANRTRQCPQSRRGHLRRQSPRAR